MITSTDGRLAGVGWLDNKVYIMDSKQMHLFSNQNPFKHYERLEKFAIEGVSSACDMTASKTTQSIFVADSSGLYNMKLPGRKVIRNSNDSTPHIHALSIPSDQVLVTASRGDPRCYYIDIHSASNFYLRQKSIILSSSIQNVLNVVQNSAGNFIFSYRNKDSGIDAISELSADRNKILRTFNPRTFKDGMKTWSPVHLAIDEKDNIFIAAGYTRPEEHKETKQGIFVLNSSFDEFHLLLDAKQHNMDPVKRIVYLKEKKQLLIGHENTIFY